jgi:outer membrane receptor protein involved in Fe transport
MAKLSPEITAACLLAVAISSRSAAQESDPAGKGSSVPPAQRSGQEGIEPAERALGTLAGEEVEIASARLPVPVPASAVPASVQVLAGESLAGPGAGALPQALARELPFVTLSDEQGNAYQPDLSLRGFQATSVAGVPQGVSVFLDGVRINEATAEEVNFDLIPIDDLEKVELVAGPSTVFGRNTLAGALNLVTARGKGSGSAFGQVEAGSAGFQKYRVRFSGTRGPVDYYLSASDSQEDGVRAASQARLSGVFGKLGLRSGGTDLALSFRYAENRILQPGPLPASLLARDRKANFTAGDFFEPLLGQLTLNLKAELGAGFSLSANAFGRKLHVEQFNVNLVADNSRLLSSTASTGGTVQLNGTAPVLGRWNLLTVGLEYTRSSVGVTVLEEKNDRTLAECTQAATASGADPAQACRLIETGTQVHDRQDAAGAYLQDTFEIARSALRNGDQLLLTAALRWDFLRHAIDDQSPAQRGRPSATGVSAFRRVDPRVGLNYNPSPEHSVYVSFSQGFRAPALLELTCAGPAAICPGLQAGTAPDPELLAVRAFNYEIGLRSRVSSWLFAQFSAYRTDVLDDIFSVSPSGTTGVYFQNIGKTRRQGLEASARGTLAPWLSGSFGYALTEATFRQDVVLATPRPTGDCTGLVCNERVRAGSELPLVPRHRLNAALDFRPADFFSVFVSCSYVSAQRLRGDEENVAPKLPAYATFGAGAHASASGLVASLRLSNLLGARFSSFGTFAPNPRLAGSPVEPFFTPGRPFEVYGSIGYGF